MSGLPVRAVGEEIVHIDLGIKGMTCASCAARIEKKLNKIDGATASVNFATERAFVEVRKGSVDQLDLIEAIRSIGYDADSIGDGNDFGSVVGTDSEVLKLRANLAASAILSIVVVAISMFPVFEFSYWQYVAFAASAVVVFYFGISFHKSAWLNLRHKSATMDTLVSVGTLSAFLFSTYELLAGGYGSSTYRAMAGLGDIFRSGAGGLYFDSASVIITVILLGRYIEARGKRKSRLALSELVNFDDDIVEVEVNGEVTSVEAKTISKGMTFRLREGSRIPVDGLIIDGSALISSPSITGEVEPKMAGAGDDVIAGAVVVEGHLTVKAQKVGKDTFVARIAARVEQAQGKKADIQHLADRISLIFVPTVISIAVIELVVRMTMGASFSRSVVYSVATLVIACPCALGLATPMATMVGLTRAAKSGILIRGPEVLERAGKIDTAVVDKTGTLTNGVFDVVAYHVAEGEDDQRLLDIVASLEEGSSHPVANSIRRYRGNYDRLKVVDFQSHLGSGLEGVIDGDFYRVGNALFVFGEARRPDEGCKLLLPEVDGGTTIFVTRNSTFIAYLVVDDTLRTNTSEALAALKSMGIDVVIASGDTPTAVGTMAKRLGIKDSFGGVVPEQKREIVANLQSAGKRVAMVGDGINDALALGSSDLGVAMGNGSAFAKEAGDVVVLSPSLAGVAEAIFIARKTNNVLRGNLFWAFIYNVIAIPLAIFGVVSPMLAGLAMAFSSVFVVLNSLRLLSLGSVGNL
ncbi:MAG: cation-translocating P-type ATPase [Actinomycetota bacterium]|nr:cation-translocating P-type ATPase [Actinomycetota bacterium]